MLSLPSYGWMKVWLAYSNTDMFFFKYCLNSLTEFNKGQHTVHIVLRDHAYFNDQGHIECGVASLGYMVHTLQLAVNKTV